MSAKYPCTHGVSRYCRICEDVAQQMESSFAAPAGSARACQCNLGNGEWDHDWQEKHDDSGGVDGGPSDHWSWRECRVCGEIEAPNAKLTCGPNL